MESPHFINIKKPILLKPLNYIHVEDNMSLMGNGKHSLSGAIGKNWMEPESWKFPSKLIFRYVVFEEH